LDNLSQEQPTDGELPPSPDPKTEGVLGEVPNSTGVLSFYSYPVFVGEGGTHSEAMMGYCTLKVCLITAWLVSF